MSHRLKQVFREIMNNNRLKFGLLIFSIILLVVIFAGRIATFDPYFLGDDLLVGPGENGHILGTNAMGQDVFSMIVYGSRTSLSIGIVSALLSGVIGTLIGAVAGYFGGKLDAFISEVINVFLMIPTFFLILIIVALFGSSLVNVMLVIGLTSWPKNARMMRVQALSIKERTYVKSAIAIGESKGMILFKYIIPNGIFPVIANTTMGVAEAILTEASLSFLGLGDPNIVSWGQMIFDGKQYVTSAWWISTFAGLAIMMIVLVFYIIGDGLNEILNPKTRR